ncbi:hypothetical protein QC761_705465 [Podospora bellae-mahoneyi]|uniref:Mitofilin n=1 Tax=Podospora bellae-mahoneyi TaxID=2093777 RepID=A0ABR0F692_9PEZI|nr:hypothetical protein QC761_705465 [Podospora bellae-mahoneyi]
MAGRFTRIAAAGLRSPVRASPVPSKCLQRRAFGSSGPGYNKGPVSGRIVEGLKLAIGFTALGLVGAITYDVTDEVLLHRHRQRHLDNHTPGFLSALENKLLGPDHTEALIDNAGGTLSDAQEELAFHETDLDAQLHTDGTRLEAQETELESDATQFDVQECIRQNQTQLESIFQNEEKDGEAQAAMESRLDDLASKMGKLKACNVSTRKVSAKKVSRLEDIVLELQARLKKLEAVNERAAPKAGPEEPTLRVSWYTRYRVCRRLRLGKKPVTAWRMNAPLPRARLSRQCSTVIATAQQP